MAPPLRALIGLAGAAALCTAAAGQGLANVPKSRFVGASTAQEAEGLAATLAQAGVGQVFQFGESIATSGGEQPAPAPAKPVAAGAPIVLMHGMGDFADNPMGMLRMRHAIEKQAGAYVHSVALCSKETKLSGCPGEDQTNGFFMSMNAQVDQFARVVRADPKLAKGFHAVGLSQGNTVIRGYIHRYNDPPVRAFVSMHGVMMGVAGLPHCPLNVPGLELLCKAVDDLVSLGAYTSVVQGHLAQANYYRDPKRLPTYRDSAHFLPYINNEVKGKENKTFADNFKSLDKLVLVMASGDTMVQPKESEHFGYFQDGSMSDKVDMRSAPWYMQDWFGLRTLDEAKKIDFHETPGDHLRFTTQFMMDMVQRYFTGKALYV